MVKINARKSAVLLAILSVLTVYVFTLRYRKAAKPTPPRLDGIPMQIGIFSGRDEYQEPESLKLLGADATVFRSYRSAEDQTIWLFVGYFGTQQEYSQIHSPKNCYPGSGWNIIREGFERIRFSEKTVPAKRLLISNGRETRDVIYWFSTAEGIITNEFMLKWYQMKRALVRKPQTTAFIRFSTIIPAVDDGTAHSNLVDFIDAVTYQIESSLYPEGQ